LRQVTNLPSSLNFASTNDWRSRVICGNLDLDLDLDLGLDEVW